MNTDHSQEITVDINAVACNYHHLNKHFTLKNLQMLQHNAHLKGIKTSIIDKKLGNAKKHNR